MITARHSGKRGDAIFSIPTLHALGVNVLYIPENTGECTGLYSSLKSLMEMQGMEVREYTSNLPYNALDTNIPVDYDMDKARLQPSKGIVHIVKRYLNAFGIKKENWKEPWLNVEGVSKIIGEYVVINFTNRHLMNEQLGIRSKVDWSKVYHSIPEKKYFIGTTEEHQYFCERFARIDRIECKDMLEVARVVNGASKVYCNQSAIMALSQSLGKELYGDFKPGKTNCIIGKEHIL